MPSYAILRVQKLKTDTAVRGSLKHAFREQNTPNADPDRGGDNVHIGASSVEEAMSNYQEKLPEKVRKNGVRCVEYLVTASPEKMNTMNKQEKDQYFSDSLAWLKDKHGADNVVYAGIHRDETSEHLYAYVVPLDDQGKLNCRKFLGGTRDVLSKMQDDFANKVAKKHGLVRGEKKSRAKHTSIKEYYSRVNKEVKIPEVDASDFHPREKKSSMFSKTLEGGEEIKARVMPQIEEEMYALGSSLRESQAQTRKALQSKNKAEKELKELKPVEDFKNLSFESQRLITQQIHLLRSKEKYQKSKLKEQERQNKGR